MNTRLILAIAVVLGLLGTGLPASAAAAASGGRPAGTRSTPASGSDQTKPDADTSMAETIRDLEVRCCLYHIVDQLQLRPEQVKALIECATEARKAVDESDAKAAVAVPKAVVAFRRYLTEAIPGEWASPAAEDAAGKGENDVIGVGRLLAEAVEPIARRADAVLTDRQQETLAQLAKSGIVGVGYALQGGWSLAEESNDEDKQAGIERHNLWAREYGAWTGTGRLLVTPHLRAVLSGLSESTGRRDTARRGSTSSAPQSDTERPAWVRDDRRTAEYDSQLERVFKVNLVNGLHLTAEQMQALLKVIRPTLERIGQVPFSLTFDSPEGRRYQRALEKAVRDQQRDRPLKDEEIRELGASRQEAWAAEAPRKAVRTVRENNWQMQEQLLTKAAAEAGALLETAQGEILATYVPCAKPERDLKNAVRAGQVAGSVPDWMERMTLTAARTMSIEAWDKDGEALVESTFKKLFPFPESLSAQRLKYYRDGYRDLLIRARAMDETDFAVKRPDLLKELASYTWASRTTDLTKQAVAAAGDRGKVIASQVRRQFFSPVMAEVLEAKLKAMEAGAKPNRTASRDAGPVATAKAAIAPDAPPAAARPETAAGKPAARETVTTARPRQGETRTSAPATVASAPSVPAQAEPAARTAPVTASAPAVPAPPAAKPVPSRPPRQGVKQRYEGIFPVAVFLAMDRPPRFPNLDPEPLKAWRRELLTTFKDLGFNTVAGTPLPEEVISLAGELGLHAMSSVQCNKLLDTPGLTKEAAVAALADSASIMTRHRHLIAGFMYTDPAQNKWLDNWRVLGGAWNELHPDVPLLATYGKAEQWRRCGQAAPVAAANAWCYVFAKDNTADQALAFPVCKGPDCRDARTEMPGLPVWAWMPGSFGGNMREPSLAEMSALYYSALAEGIRGCLLTSYHPVSPENPAAPADETGQPGPLLLAMKPMLQKFGKMGRMLLPYEVNDNLRCEASGKAYAGVYSGQDGLAKHVMLASKDVANKQTVLLGFTPGTPAPTQLRDALDGSVISVVVKDGLATGTVDIDAADSRLLEVVRAGANAAAERPAASSARETAPKTPTTAPAAADRAAHHHAGTTPCGP